MVNATVRELQRRNDVVWEALGETLEGMEAHLEQSDAPGEWTAREVLCHLLFEPGWKPVALLERFAIGNPGDLPLVEITPGSVTVTPERRRMTLAELARGASTAQRREVFGYLADARRGRSRPPRPHPGLRPAPRHRRGPAARLRRHHVRPALGRAHRAAREDPSRGRIARSAVHYPDHRSHPMSAPTDRTTFSPPQSPARRHRLRPLRRPAPGRRGAHLRAHGARRAPASRGWSAAAS